LAHGRHGNAFREYRTRLRTAGEWREMIGPLRGRSWLGVNDGSKNALGEPVGYRLVPGENVVPFAAADSALARRAGFVYRHVWVTPYSPDERYAAGEYPNQSAGGDGLPAWVAEGRGIEDEDVVLWYTFGLHHQPRPGDGPVMRCPRSGSMLKPAGFFDENPALDVPPPAHCEHG